MSTPIANLLDKRKLKSGRKNECIQNFYAKRDRAHRLMIYARKSKNSDIIAEANNQFLVAIVTAFEVYMADLLNELISRKKINAHNLNIGKREFPLKDVVFIVENKITIGELYCNTLNFEDLRDLELLLSQVFNLSHFFDYLRKHKFKYVDNRNQWQEFVFEKDFYTKLADVFKRRHEIVHDISFRKTPTVTQAWNIGILMTRFVHSIEILANRFRDNRTCDIIER